MPITNYWNQIATIESNYAQYRKKILTKFALTAAECDILLFLANNPLCDTGAEIAKIRRIPKSQVSLAVSSLSERGLVRKKMFPNNRKSIHLSLTEEAEPIVAYGAEIQRAFSRMLFGEFTEAEKAEFFRLHEKLAKTAENQRGKEIWTTEL